MDTLNFILQKSNITYDDKTPMPIDIPNVGRDNLAQWLHELNFKTGVEVGVAEGKYNEVLCKSNPQMTVYGVDAWQTYQDYPDYKGWETLDPLYQKAVKRLEPYPNHKIIKAFSADGAKQFTDDSLDFVYIDANHSDPYISQDIEAWSLKVRTGGIISGHDYVWWVGQNYHVKEDISGYTQKHKIRPYFVLGSRGEEPGEIRDKSRSWMWVKP